MGFPAVQPPADTAFQCYAFTKNAEENKEKEFAEQRMIVGGETASVDFLTASQVERDDAGCRSVVPTTHTLHRHQRLLSSYYIAVHNTRTKHTTLRAAPLHLLRRDVKALKGIDPAPVSAAERTLARTQLGHAFGTKKAQAAIRARERNKVDVAAVRDVAEYLQNRIAKNTEALPTTGARPNLLFSSRACAKCVVGAEEAIANADAARLVPKFNMAASDPGEVYALADIISDSELKAIPADAIAKAKTPAERNAQLPFRHSTWVKQHLHLVCSAPKPNKTNMCASVFIDGWEGG